MNNEIEAICFQKIEERSLKWIFFSVLIAHLSLFCFMGLKNQVKRSVKNEPKKVVVQTIQLKNESTKGLIAIENQKLQKESIKEDKKSLNHTGNEKKEIKKKETIKEPEKTNKSQPSNVQIKKPIEKKVEPKKKSDTNKKVDQKPVVKKEQNANSNQPKKQESSLQKKEEVNKLKQKELLKEASLSLAKMDQSKTSSIRNDLKKVSKTNIKTDQIGSLNIESLDFQEGTSLSIKEVGYRNEIASRLKSLLKLPEHGQVKIKLTLQNSGKVLNVLIVSFESEKNRSYIEKNLKNFSFPSFEGIFNNAKEYTFSVTLTP